MTTESLLEERTLEPIVVDNLVLDGEAVRRSDGEYLVKSQQGWEHHFAGSGKRIPTVGEYIAIMKQLDEKHEPALQGILQDLSESGLCAGKIDYRNSNLPIGNGYLDQLVKDQAWRRALEEEVFSYDAPETVDMLERVSGKRPHIWTPSAEGRKSNPGRAVWVSVDTDRFYLNCYNYPISIIGRSRGVRGELYIAPYNREVKEEN